MSFHMTGAELREKIMDYNSERYHEQYVPGHTITGLVNLVDHGHMPGSFIESVLENDLTRAAFKADDLNMENLAFIAKVVAWTGLGEWFRETFKKDS